MLGPRSGMALLEEQPLPPMCERPQGALCSSSRDFKGWGVIFRISFLFRALRLQELPRDGWAVVIMGEPKWTGQLCLGVRRRSGSRPLPKATV